MRKLTETLLARHLHAGIFIFLLVMLSSVGLPGAFLAGVFLSFVIFQQGPFSGAKLLLWVALPAISSFFSHIPWGAYDILFLKCFLTFVFASLFTVFRAWRPTVLAATLIALISIVGLHFVFPELQKTWTDLLAHLLKSLNLPVEFSLSSQQTQYLLNYGSAIMTGSVGFVILFSSFLQLFLGRWWQKSWNSTQKNTLRTEILGIRMTPAVVFIITVLALVLLLDKKMLWDCLPIMLFPFALSGICLLHSLSNQYPAWNFLLIVIYISFLLIPFVPILLLAGLGYVDAFFKHSIVKR